MKDARRILVLTLSFGSGHVHAARAVAEELERQSPQAEVLVLDALENARLLFRALYVWPYWTMLRYAPVLWKKFFERRVARKSEQTAPACAFRYGCPEVFNMIKRFEPDTIIAVEVAACELAVIARRAGLTRAAIVNVITDHEAEPVWVKPEVAVYAVADEGVRDQLRAWGASSEKIFVSGIPTDQAFHLALNSRASRRVNDALPLVLLMGGGMGPTRMDQIAASLCESQLPMRLVAIAGRDERTYKRLARINSSGSVRLDVLGWTEGIAALMRDAAVLVTKPGGLTLSEAAQCGLPVVMFGGIPGPETLNAERFASAGAGIVARSAQEAAQAVAELLLDDARRAAMSLESRKLARPDAASNIARLAIGGLEGIAMKPPRRRTA